MRKKTERVGETNIATNGQKMTILKYRKNTDIDVVFEDGTVVVGKTYLNFKNGNIKNPNCTLADLMVGTESMSAEGELVKIAEYSNARNISVTFSKSNVTKKTDMRTFRKKQLKKATGNSLADKRIGETSIATNGQKMTIVAYRNANDIDVEFEDQTLVTNTRYDRFKCGYIKNPDSATPKNKHNKSLGYARVGEESIATNGQKMTILKYKNHQCVDVIFDDGTIVTGKQYACFKAGNIKNPNACPRIGETVIATNGMKMTITAYRGYHDIDVTFENGVVAEKKSYANFKTGSIKCPSNKNHS